MTITQQLGATTTRVLAGKVALVTGGSRGIGAATARALAEAGADVAISYVASAGKAEQVAAELTRDHQVRAAAYRADQADAAQVAELVAAVAQDFGRFDILVNNAGVFAGGRVDDPETDTAALQQQVAVNLGGVTAAIRAASAVLGEDGRIITVGSNLASRPTRPGMADYAATKAAIVAYSKAAALDLAHRGITVNVVQSGSVATDMNPEDGPTADAQRALSALGRYGRPEEVAAGIAFLAGPSASFITGTTLNIDGGYLA
ncbi:SDR family NAD(P)-dependent oxidoreductase [Kitasatospora sp. NPDC006697]|uniref:SDR family NAD(P)-dependent oxidoreductase n=1 Tax=Kitasatospora sp. NPDC006697 TaxID=3364020 RepID=UPI0036ABCA0D